MTEPMPGAHWIRAALQVNPYSYKGKNEPSKSFDSEDAYNRALLDECERIGVGLIAITDHWCVDSASDLIMAANDRGIVALPGFEANSSEGVHLLVIFERGTATSKINAAIGICGSTPGADSGPGTCSYKEILEKMTERGALVIPAHVNADPSGLLCRISGKPLEQMLLHPDLQALGISPDLPGATNQAKILGNQKPFKRKHRLAVVYADDIVHPDQLQVSGATTWFKVSSSCVESLRLAVRTPQTRVALEDPTGIPRSRLRQISWTGGFLDGVTIPISSDLTALIGGRGTGKSTVIESLRYAFGLKSIGRDSAADHKAIVDKVLRSGTIVRVEAETVTPTPHRYTIERVVPNPPIVRDTDGTKTRQQPEDVIGAVEIFGQHELAELAGSPDNVADMLRRFAGTDGISAAHQEVIDKLVANRGKLEAAEAARDKLKEELDDIPRLEEQVQQFKETDVAKRLAEMQRLERDKSVFKEADQRVQAASDALTVLTEPQLDSTLSAEFDGVAGAPQRDKLERATAAVAALAVTLKDLAVQAQEAINTAKSGIAAARTDWDAAVRDQRDGHSEVLRKLHDEGLEPDKYLDTTKMLDALKAKKPRLKSQDKVLDSLQDERDKLLGELAEHERRQVEALHEAVRSANDKTGGVVVVRPIASPDRSGISAVLVKHTSGARTQIMAAVAADDFSPRSLVTAIRGGVDELAKLGIKGAQASGLIDAGVPLQRELEEMVVGHAVEVLLDISANGGARELKTMEELSKGQRATALLLLLLGASTAPLVIDQPEDDLDNRFVYDGVVAYLRRLKGVRQIIVSTHNANVPVLGDAELIVALEGDGQHGMPAKGGIGSLDDAPIRSLAENLLEGGPAAFNARQHLYGF